MADLSGKCLCGNITWRSTKDPFLKLICHCQSCRRASSAAFAAFVGFMESEIGWSQPPATYASSPQASRGFCPNCGSSLFFKSARWPGQLHIYAATLDDPASYKADQHVVWEEHVSWADINDGLPRHISFSQTPNDEKPPK